MIINTLTNHKYIKAKKKEEEEGIDEEKKKQQKSSNIDNDEFDKHDTYRQFSCCQPNEFYAFSFEI